MDNQVGFKHKCPNCGTPTVNYDPNKKAFCSRTCEKNFKYGDKFADSRYFKSTPSK